MTEFSSHVAVVGFATRFPGAPNSDEFWRTVSEGREPFQQYTDEELLAAGVPEYVLRDPKYVKVGSPLEGIEMFDAPFFGYSPREATLLDPQQRIFLEAAWQAMEHAGYDTARYDGRVGVFAGTELSEYLLNNLLPRRDEFETVFGYHIAVLGNEQDSLPTRVSYKMNLRGPSFAVSSHCSTSLVATTLGWQSLIDYQCDMALTGGVCCKPGKRGHIYIPGAMYSPDGHVRPFDKRAAGIRDASGVAIAVLKRLEDALADGDRVYAVIRGAAINHDGSAKVGFTAPGIQGQAEVITEALALADVDADTIGYVETHGTATPLGDPVEVTALTRAYRATTERKQYCRLGAVKANFGHTSSAAGAAGFVKAVLALHHRKLPPMVNFETPNPEIDFANSPFYVSNQPADWPRGETPRRAGVSAFGMGGTNAHIILEEAPEVPASSPSRHRQHLLALSAKSATALERSIDNLAVHLRGHDDPLADVSFTLLVGRAQLPQRRILVAGSAAEAADLLQARAPERLIAGQATERAIALFFPDKQHVRAGAIAGLYDSEPVFREVLDAGIAALRPELGAEAKERILALGTDSAKAKGVKLVARVRQLVVDVGLARLLTAWGLQAGAFVGWGTGELSAACAAGVLGLEPALQALVAELRGSGGKLQAADLRASEVPIFTARGRELSAADAVRPETWAESLAGTAPAVGAFGDLAKDPRWLLVTPGPVAAEALEGAPTLYPCTDPRDGGVRDGGGDDRTFLLSTVGRLWTLGAAIDWRKFFGEEKRRRVALPAYSFDRLRYWIDPPVGVQRRSSFTAPSEVGMEGDEAPAAAAPAGAPAAPAVASVTERLRSVDRSGVPFVEPENEMEREIARIWEEVLGVGPIGREDSFLELGGDSLMMTRLVTRLHETYEVDVPLTELLQASTLAEVAVLVARQLIADTGEENVGELLAELAAAEEDG